MLPTVVIRPPAYAQHVPPRDHPDTADRVDAAWRGTHAAPPVNLEFLDCEDFDLPVDALLAVHTPEYVHSLLNERPGYLPDGETWLGDGSLRAATQSAAAACDLIGRIARGAAKNGIVLTRPAGHHAHADRASGYCILNNVVLAARAGQRCGLGRVLIVDLDAHHGDGTESLVLGDPSIGLVSIHEAGLFPRATGGVNDVTPGGAANIVNIPLQSGAGDADLAAAVDLVERFAEQFAPDLLLLSLGSDGHVCDPMSSLTYSTHGIAWSLGRLVQTGERLCAGRVGVVLEGGYDYQSLMECFSACAQVLSQGQTLDRPMGTPNQTTMAVIEMITWRLPR